MSLTIQNQLVIFTLESCVDAFLSANNLLLLAWSSGLGPPWFNTSWGVPRSHCFTSPAGLDKDGMWVVWWKHRLLSPGSIPLSALNIFPRQEVMEKEQLISFFTFNYFSSLMSNSSMYRSRHYKFSQQCTQSLVSPRVECYFDAQLFENMYTTNSYNSGTISARDITWRSTGTCASSVMCSNPVWQIQTWGKLASSLENLIILFRTCDEYFSSCWCPCLSY